MRAVFITGTGTEVGKTYFSALFLKRMLELGMNAGYYKPVTSGTVERDGRRVAGDADFVCRLSGLDATPNALVSFIYDTEVSPHLAAKIEGNPPRLDKIASDFEELAKKFDFIIVEGCGGIVCPLSHNGPGIMLTDVIKKLGLDILIVSPAGLGSINGTVLTADYAHQNGIAVRGVIMNGCEENFMHEDNRKVIEKLAQAPVVARVAKNAANLELPRDEILKIFGGIAN